jgi:UDP-galactopyranose mutase
MPKDGYTTLIERMLDHSNIRVRLNTPFEPNMAADFYHTFNSMPIDEYFESDLGELPYRSIKFHTVNLPVPRNFPVATVNFTHDGPYTRVTEWKNFPNHGSHAYATTLTFEEPCDYKDNSYQRYYPVKDISKANWALYKRYKERVPSHMTFIGRCGMYVYLDMHQAISSSMTVAQEFLAKHEGLVRGQNSNIAPDEFSSKKVEA